MTATLKSWDEMIDAERRALHRRRFDGAVYDEIATDTELGRNIHGQQVVRLDLKCNRGPVTCTHTLILAIDAAIALRNDLEGLFGARDIWD